jgi:hypothetical protein
LGAGFEIVEGEASRVAGEGSGAHLIVKVGVVGEGNNVAIANI